MTAAETAIHHAPAAICPEALGDQLGVSTQDFMSLSPLGLAQLTNECAEPNTKVQSEIG